MATRLEDFRTRDATLSGDAHFELKNAKGEVFKPNIFIDIEDNGMVRIWVESGGEVLIPDEASIPLKNRLTWMTAKVTTDTR